MLVKYDLDDKGNGHVFNRKKIFVELETKYQKVEISEVEVLGKILALDNIIQLSSLDSDRYHEAFAHIPASNLENPKSFLILGGGDGILAKELLKYKDATVDLVDIDEEVCKLSSNFLNDLNGDCYNNKLLKAYYIDALEYCQSCEKTYDIIFADITDPHPNSPSKSLLGVEALKTYKTLLKESGFFVVQTDNIQIAPDHRKNIESELKNHFKNVGSYGICAITLSSLFSFTWGSDISKIKKSSIEVDTSWLNSERYDFCLSFDKIT